MRITQPKIHILSRGTHQGGETTSPYNFPFGPKVFQNSVQKLRKNNEMSITRWFKFISPLNFSSEIQIMIVLLEKRTDGNSFDIGRCILRKVHSSNLKHQNCKNVYLRWLPWCLVFLQACGTSSCSIPFLIITYCLSKFAIQMIAWWIIKHTVLGLSGAGPYYSILQ